MRPVLEVREVRVFAPGRRKETILRNVSFAIESGEVLSIVGRSGVGKTSLLKCIAGLVQFEGSIVHEGAAVVNPSRRRGLVFQEHSVFPWLTVRENLAVGARAVEGRARPDADRTVEELLVRIGLEADARKYPSALSGGMRQRVAIARSLAADPSLLLLDEPFASLDLVTRQRMQRLIADVMTDSADAVVLVTHDLGDAIALSDQVLVITGKPGEVTDRFVGCRRAGVASVSGMLEIERRIAQILVADAEASR